MKYIKTMLIALLLVTLLFSMGACQTPKAAVAATTATATPTTAPTATPAPEYTLAFINPTFFGCTHAIISANFSLTANPLGEHGFVIDEQISIPATQVDGISYAVLDGLEPNTEYTFNLWYTVDSETKTTPEGFKFKTPQRQLSLDAVGEYIAAELKGKTITEENHMLLQTQACLSLLGLERDRYGKWGGITQANITRIVYTANSLDGFVDYSRITALADEYTLNLLKDILSADFFTNGEALIRPFVPAPYTLSQYAVLTEDGGSLDIERYIAELTEKNETIKAIYSEYPYEVDDALFKQKYADTINDDKFTEQGLTTKLAGYAAKNKAMFSYKTKDWMKEVAKPKERLVTFASSDNEITVNAFVAYTYMLIDAYRATGDVFVTSTTYRNTDKQWFFYSKKQGVSVAYRFNGSWHLERQVYSYVPGFSNHQYGVAIDFYERNAFGSSDLFTYVSTYGANYGYYNYYLEPWHWVYLGTSF